jgi:hypothetical protein
MLHPSTVRR